VRRHLPSSPRGREGASPRVRRVHTRGERPGQLALPLGRAERKGGAS
jgi:hypothetical protein